MIDLPEEIIKLILSYAPDFRDNLKKCHKELLSNHRPVYYKKVVRGFKPRISDSQDWSNFKKNNEELMIWRRGHYRGPMEYMELKLCALEITPSFVVLTWNRDLIYYSRNINLYYGWGKSDNINFFRDKLLEHGYNPIDDYTPGYY